MTHASDRPPRAGATRLVAALEVAAWAAAARAATLLLLEPRLSAVSLDEPGRSVAVAGAGGLVGGLLVGLASAARAPLPVRLVAGLIAAGAVAVTQFGWPHARGLDFWPAEGGAVDGARLAVGAVVGVFFASRLLAPPPPRAVTAALLVASLLGVGLLAPRVERRAQDLRPELVRWRVETSLLESPAYWRAVSSHPERSVETAVFSPTTNTSANGGPRPALVMVPPARVRIEVPFEWAEAGARLDLAAGIAEDAWKHLGRQRGLVFRARVGERTVFERVLVRKDHPGARDERTSDAREWHEAELGLTGVEEVVLEVETTDGSTVPPELVCGFANLLVEVPERTRSELSSRFAPSAVFVVIDTMRGDAYDPAPDGDTPNMARIGARGTTFERAYAASSWTWPSTASLLTALTPLEHGVQDAASNYLSERWLTLPERLQTEGFATAAWSMNPLVSAAKNFDQGFETFHETEWERADTVADDVVAWIEEHARHRFLLFLQFTDPHGPYDPPSDLKERYEVVDPQGYDHTALEILQRKGRERTPLERALWPAWVEHAHRLYDLEVVDVDRTIGRILDALAELGIDDRTVVVLTSDHGEEFLEHGRLGHGPQLFEETIHVPMLVAGPGVPAGAVEPAVSPNRFLAPTLLRLLGVEPTANLVGPDLFLREGLDDAVLLSTAIGDWRGVGRRDIYGIREGQWLYHYGVEPGGTRRNEALFDLSESLLAQNNLARTRTGKALVGGFRERVLAWIERSESVRPRAFGADTSTLEMLEMFGYAEVAERGAADGAPDAPPPGGNEEPDALEDGR